VAGKFFELGGKTPGVFDENQRFRLSQRHQEYHALMPLIGGNFCRGTKTRGMCMPLAWIENNIPAMRIIEWKMFCRPASLQQVGFLEEREGEKIGNIDESNIRSIIPPAPRIYYADPTDLGRRQCENTRRARHAQPMTE